MVNKRIVAAVLVVLMASCVNQAFADNPKLEINAKSAILIEASTGRVLYEQDCDAKYAPASVTKIMTMLLTMEALESGKIKIDDMVSCSEYAAGMGGSQVYLSPGEKMTVNDMLKAIAVASGNDASVAMAEHISGSIEGFIEMMNKRAKELGMVNTNFMNATGLDDPNHYTSARDISIMSRELLKHKKIFDYTKIWMDTLRDGKFTLSNTNKLIRFYDGATGLKTGSTGTAMYCLSASATRGGMDLIAVVMGAPTTQDRFSSAKKLLDHGFSNFKIVKCIEKGEVVGEIAVTGGTKDKVNYRTSDQCTALVSKGNNDEVKRTIVVPETIEAKVDEGQVIGSIKFTLGDTEVGTVDLVAAETVEKLTFGKAVQKLLGYWIGKPMS